MNQSRMLLLAKGTGSAKPPSPQKKKPQGRDLRVPSSASAASAQTVTSAVPSLKQSHALAMKSRPGLNRNNGAGGAQQPNTAERRIMSLNQIPANSAGRAPTPASLAAGVPQSLKRSHSVKTQSSLRKPSWASKQRELSFASATSLSNAGGEDKENSTLPEEAEEDQDFEDAASDAQTERRTSYLSDTETERTYEGTETDVQPITPGLESEVGSRMSYGTSDLSYMTGTGSYMTGSDIDGDRRTSIASSANGVVGGGVESTISEEPEPAGEGAESVASSAAEEDGAPLQIEASKSQDGDAEAGEADDELAELADIARDKKDVFFDPHDADSGLGTDIPTAALSSVGGDGGYFRE